MGFSEIPPPPEERPGRDDPALQTRPPGPQTRTWLTRAALAAAPMGPVPTPDAPPATVVLASGKGANVLDVDGNRYVDLAAGFGALLLGHAPPEVRRVLELQLDRLWQALGDVLPSDAKIGLCERLTRLLGAPGEWQAILGQSGADAVSAALKTAALATGRPGVLAFEGAYHGLGYGPLAACGLRGSYRAPFAEQLNAHVVFAPYPGDEEGAERALAVAAEALATGRIGATLIEPILGRGGCVVPPDRFLRDLAARTRTAGALLVADEIWTGLGRAGAMLRSRAVGIDPDLVCLGKGLGGGLPISACLGRRDVMACWRRAEEVVHTSTFAGAPLACAAALATLDTLSRSRLAERSARLGTAWLEMLHAELRDAPGVRALRGAGLMIGVELEGGAGSASSAARALLGRGYVVSTGGGSREVLVLTPPLNVDERLLWDFVPALRGVLHGGV